MKQFNVQRFLNVARWDLTINRKFYTRAAISIMAAVCMPVIVYYLSEMTSGRALFLREFKDDYVGVFANIILAISGLIGVMAFGYIFHNFITKQGRISELTLPATNLEKFVWHVIVTAIGVELVLFVGVVIADLLHVLLGSSLLRLTEFNSITEKVYFDPSLYTLPLPANRPVLFIIVIYLLVYNYMSTFALVNAWKYKHNIPLTLVLQFALSLGSMLLLGLSVTYLKDHAEAMISFFRWLDDLDPTVISVTLVVILAAILCLIWTLTYRLYCRAQLTTKRNP